VLALPTAFAVYVTVVVMTIIDAGGIGAAGLPMALPNLVLVAIYVMVGFYVTRTQLFNRWPLGGWSLSGLSLAVIVPTCAAMHGVFAISTRRGDFAVDTHLSPRRGLAVGAGRTVLPARRALAVSRQRSEGPFSGPPCRFSSS